MARNTAPPHLILLHGGGADHRLWASTAPLLADRFRVDTPDMPGHGAAPAPPEPTVASLARALAADLAPRIRGPYHLVGHSLGGMAAMALAATDLPPPERLVLADTFLRPSTGLDRSARMLALHWGAAVLGNRNATRAVLDRMDLGTDGFDATLRASMTHPHAWPLHTMMGAMRRFDGRPHLARIACPTLLLMAGGNASTDGEGERMARHLAHPTIRVMPGAGHLQMRDDPALFVRLVGDFLLGTMDPP
ncbi:alpha/beta hydrolase [Jannaschia sp. LMIT008]|uniref:alpha/beta fold hydrolase n=1 Tax=Jannaschia maritima TaxID=3032585 RepID=UPI0028128190|nr:alpha/beta hydrolase [Jannaschia sp. LMIT008]